MYEWVLFYQFYIEKFPTVPELKSTPLIDSFSCLLNELDFPGHF